MRKISLLVPLLSAQFVHGNDWGHMYPGSGHMFWNFGFIGLFFMILFLAAVIFLIYWVVKRSTESQQQKPLDILKERYARGEITKTEYEKKKKELEN
ncbi:MAG: SHOCT domain-containing protein [Candidatus Woesearchaeota archaeon]